MTEAIHLEAEGVRIIIDSEEQLSKKHDISTEGAIVKCIKHVYRYGEFTMPKDVMIRILWLAHKGEKCNKDHFSISQRTSLYNYLKDKEVKDPYIQQFINETKEMLKC